MLLENLHNGNRPLLSMDSLMVFGMDTTLLEDADDADDFFFFLGLSSTYLVADLDRPVCRYAVLPPLR